MAEFATGDREEALDLVQETMLKLAEKYRHKPETDWKPLFYRILQSRIRDWYRRQAVRNRVLLRPADSPDTDKIQLTKEQATINPESNLESERFAPALEAALMALPLRQRQAFLLRIWEGFDVRQCAVAMGCREGSVKTHLFRALQSLRIALAEFR